jgi:hypothetical protein
MPCAPILIRNIEGRQMLVEHSHRRTGQVGAILVSEAARSRVEVPARVRVVDSNSNELQFGDA